MEAPTGVPFGSGGVGPSVSYLVVATPPDPKGTPVGASDGRIPYSKILLIGRHLGKSPDSVVRRGGPVGTGATGAGRIGRFSR